jgi:hypothetical protein
MRNLWHEVEYVPMTQQRSVCVPVLFLLRGVAVVCLGALFITNPVRAQEIPALATVAVPLEQATNIKAQPLAILSKFPSAGPALARYVAQILAKEPATLDAMLSIIPDTSPEQAAAIGAGMVRALRTLAGKQGDAAHAFSFKILQSENPWLKTTFMAIGPRGAGSLSVGGYSVRPDAPYPTANNAGGGGPIGIAMAIDESRVGPSRVSGSGATARGMFTKDAFDSQLNRDLTRYGMIVAIIESDAPSNGVVSTSPTI